MSNIVSRRWWLRLPALFVLLALGFAHADITKAQSIEYRLGPGDRIKVAVFGRSDLSGIYTIRNSGALSLPIAGEISASNLTLNELETEIGDQYSVLMKSESGPDQTINVNIEIVEHRPFYIMGDVSRPGSYEYQNRLTVVRAIAIAGGYASSSPDARVNETGARSDSAEEKERAKVRITRETNRGRVSIDASDNTVVLPGDIISVPSQEGDAFLSLPDRGQQAESVEAASVEEDAVSETEAGAVTDSEAIPAAVDSTSDYVYTLYMFSTTSEEVADQVNQKFQRAGHESRIIVTTKADVTRYRIVVTGFESRQAAQQYAESITGTLGVTSTWIGRGQPGN